MFDFASFVTKYPIGDYHPPGYFALLWIWTHLFGFSEIAVRLPSVFLGVGTVIFTYLLGKELFAKKTALIASLLLAVAPLHVYYSQEARMYSLSAFSAAASSYFLWQMVKGKKWSMLGYIVASVLVLYSDYVTYLIFPAHFIYLLISHERVWKRWLASLFFSFLAFLPWLGVFPQQIIEGREASLNLPGWEKVAGGADLKNVALVFIKTIVGRISFDNKWIYGMISAAGIIVYGWLIFLSIKKMNPAVKFLLLWFSTPLVLAVLISNFLPMLSYFRMLYILPALYLLLAYGLTLLPKQTAKFLTIVLVVANIFFLGIYYTNSKFQREDWRGATKFLDKVAGDSSIVLFEDNHVKFPYLYYTEGKSLGFRGLKHVQAKSDRDVEDVEKLLNDRKRIYLFEYLVEITDPQRLLEKRIRGIGFSQKDVYNFQGVGLIRLYEKD